MKEGVSRIKNGIALEKSFSASGRANDGALAAGEYRIAKELMDTLSTDAGTPRSVRQALEKKAVEVQRRLDSLEVKLPSESRAQAQALAAKARADRKKAASAVKIQAVVRGRHARAATVVLRAETQRQQVAATRIQARYRANVVRGEIRATSATADADPATDDELEDDIMEMLMSPSTTHELAGPPPPPPPPQPYTERLAVLQHQHRELEAQPSIPPFDAPAVTASVTACTTHTIRPLLQRAMRAVASTVTLQVEQTALEYIAGCFVAGELLPLEPEAEPAPEPAPAGRERWYPDRTLAGFLGALQVQVANAISMGLVEHLQVEEDQLKSSDRWERRLTERIGQQLLLASNSLDGENQSALDSSLQCSSEGAKATEVKTAAASAAEDAATAAAVAAEAAEKQAQLERLAALRGELAGLRLSALRKRADAFGADEEMIDDAEDSDDPKEALVSLIVSLATSG